MSASCARPRLRPLSGRACRATAARNRDLRMMALLAFPVAAASAARSAPPNARSPRHGTHGRRRRRDEPQLLNELTRLAASVESSVSESKYRFGAAAALHELTATAPRTARRAHPRAQTIGESWSGGSRAMKPASRSPSARTNCRPHRALERSAAHAWISSASSRTADAGADEPPRETAASLQQTSRACRSRRSLITPWA